MTTQKEKIAMYESLLHDIQMYREVVLNGDKVKQLLDNIGSWSYAHRQGNGELTEQQQKRLITSNFKKLRDVR